MKVIAWIFLIILILIAVLAVGMGILSHIRAAEREERTIELQQENLIYKEKIERLCVFPSGYAPTVSGKMFNLTDYNIAIKDTIFDVKKDVVYGASLVVSKINVFWYKDQVASFSQSYRS